jgi:peptidyl-prolyl cis-trans isomerase D
MAPAGARLARRVLECPSPQLAPRGERNSMLKALRDSMKYLAWVLWAVIAVFVFMVWGEVGAPPPGATSRWAATVGGEEVSFREFEREYRELEEQLRASMGAQYTPEMAEQMRLPVRALDRLISRKILAAEARRLGLSVSRADLQREILELPIFTDSSGQFVGEETYQDFVRRMGYTSASFEAAMREQILVNRLVGALGQALVITDSELEERYRREVEEARIRYLTLPFEAMREELAVSEEDLAAHFAARREAYRVPEERVAQYLLVDERRLRETVELPEEELRAFYEERREEYAEPEQVRARHVLVSTAERDDAEARRLVEVARQRIAAGEPFAEVAREVSEDPGTAPQGGDLGFFGRGRMVPEFEQAAFGAAVGELAGPVQTAFGYHLVEVVERREARQRPFEEVREQIRSRLAGDQASELAERRARQLHGELTAGPAPGGRELEQAAERDAAVSFQTPEPFRAEGPILPLGTAPGLNEAAFRLEEGGLTEPIRTPRGWVVLRLAQVRPARLPELDEVREEVRREVEERELRRLVVARLEGAREAGDLGQAAERLGLELRESESFGHGGFIGGELGVAPEIAEAALEASEGALLGPFEHRQGGVLIEVLERSEMTAEGFATARRDLEVEIRQEKLDLAVTALIQQRRRELGVRYDRGLLERWNLLDDGSREV